MEKTSNIQRRTPNIQCPENPNGIPAQSPGLRACELPWVPVNKCLQPQRGCGPNWHRFATMTGDQPNHSSASHQLVRHLRFNYFFQHLGEVAGGNLGGLGQFQERADHGGVADDGGDELGVVKVLVGLGKAVEIERQIF